MAGAHGNQRQRVVWYWPFARPEEMALATAFAATGSELTVQVIDRDAAPAAQAPPPFAIVNDLPDVDRSARGARWLMSRVRTYWRRSKRRKNLLARLEPDVAHYHYLNRFTDWFRPPRCTWVVSVHDVEPHQPRLGRFERVVAARLYRRPNGIIVHHQWLADRLQHRYSVAPERIAVVPLQVFPVADPSPRPDHDRPMVLCFGALRPNKGLAGLIETMRRPEMAGIDLHIAGRGDARYQEVVEQLAATCPNVSTEIGFVSLDRKDELFRAAQVVVMPYEAFSSQSAVLHDAYGHARPVVVTDVGALGDSVRHDQTGRVVAVNDQSSLAAAMVAMIGPEGDRAASAARAAAAARTPEVVADALHQAYRRFGATTATAEGPGNS